MTLNKTRESDPGLIVPTEKQGGAYDAFFWVSDGRALHAELNAKGADIVYGPVIREAYQMKEFAVRDCDGHLLGFGQALRYRSLAFAELTSNGL
jgi:hypothetical protein